MYTLTNLLTNDTELMSLMIKATKANFSGDQLAIEILDGGDYVECPKSRILSNKMVIVPLIKDEDWTSLIGSSQESELVNFDGYESARQWIAQQAGISL